MKNQNIAKGLTGKKWNKKVLAKIPNTKTPLTLNKIPGMPHNVIFTRDVTPVITNKGFEISIWGVQSQVYKVKGVWWGKGDNLLGVISLKEFNRLFCFSLPKGKAVNGRVMLCGGLRTK
jgi:hypothetical protein